MKTRCALFLAALALIVAACGGSDSVIETTSETPATPADEPTTAVEAVADDPAVEEPAVEEPAVAPVQSSLPADTVVLVWSETGGCAQIGPNCFRYEITADGGVTSFREGSTNPELTGQISIDLVSAWIGVVNDTDIDTLVAGLPEGEMTAAFDGTDFTLEVPFADISLSSVDVKFDRGEWFFTSADAVVASAAGVTQPELESR